MVVDALLSQVAHGRRWKVSPVETRVQLLVEVGVCSFTLEDEGDRLLGPNPTKAHTLGFWAHQASHLFLGYFCLWPHRAFFEFHRASEVLIEPIVDLLRGLTAFA